MAKRLSQQMEVSAMVRQVAPVLHSSASNHRVVKISSQRMLRPCKAKVRMLGRTDGTDP